MSECIITGTAVTAVSSSINTFAAATGAAVVGGILVAGALVAGAAYATYKGVTWLTEAEKRELEKLRKELSKSIPTHLTTEEARKDFQKKLAVLKAQAEKNSLLKNKATQVAQLVALQTSPLGLFLIEEQKLRLQQAPPNQRGFKEMLQRVEKRFTEANAFSVVGEIKSVAAGLGFHLERTRTACGIETLVLENSNGQAISAQVKPSDRGAQISVDLLGFGDGRCHSLMDELLKGLEEKGIRIGAVRRQSHYRRDGLLHSDSRGPQEKKELSPLSRPDRQREEARRRQTVLSESRRLKRG